MKSSTPLTLTLTPTSPTTFTLTGKHASTHPFILRSALRSIALINPNLIATEIATIPKSGVTVTTRDGAGLGWEVLALEIARRYSQVHGSPCVVLVEVK